MNLISGVHHSCERREHTFMVLREYTIISLETFALVFINMTIDLSQNTLIILFRITNFILSTKSIMF